MSIVQQFTSGVKIFLETLRVLARNPILFVYMSVLIWFGYSTQAYLYYFGVSSIFAQYVLKGAWVDLFVGGLSKVGLDLLTAVTVMLLSFHTIKVINRQATGIGDSIKASLSKFRQFIPWGFVCFAFLFIVNVGISVLWDLSKTKAWLPVSISKWIFLVVTGPLVVLYIIFLYLAPVIVAAESITLHSAIAKTPQVIKKLFIGFFFVFAPIVLVLAVLTVNVDVELRRFAFFNAAVVMSLVWDIVWLTAFVVMVTILYLRHYKKELAK